MKNVQILLFRGHQIRRDKVVAVTPVVCETGDSFQFSILLEGGHEILIIEQVEERAEIARAQFERKWVTGHGHE
jgi:hypothetical protein